MIGLLINSAALIAEGIHSTLDVFSSFITYLGIRIAKKPPDERHPYGHQAAETLGGLAVSLLLAVSGIWIIYEGAIHLVEREAAEITLWGFAIMIVSIILNEIMARLKFKYGRQEESLALIADAEHSRVDVIASAGVLVGLFLIRYFSLADGIIAILIGIYILKESFGIGMEVTDNLMGVKDEKVEAEIKRICQEKSISVSDLKTKKLGSAVSAELHIKLNPELKIEEAERISQELQKDLLEKIERLKYLIINIGSHEIKEGIVRPTTFSWGWRRGFRFKEEGFGRRMGRGRNQGLGRGRFRKF